MYVPVWVSNLFMSQFQKVRMSLSEIISLKATDGFMKMRFPNSVPETFHFQIIKPTKLTLFF